MGRSPTWYQYVDPLAPRPHVEHLGLTAHFDAIIPTTTDEPTVNAGDPAVAFSASPDLHHLRFRVTSVTGLPMEVVAELGLGRSCSTYGYDEDPAPDGDGKVVYTIESACRYRFLDARKTFSSVYDVFYIKHPSPSTLCTWALRTDGLVLNIESFEPMLYIDKIEWVDR